MSGLEGNKTATALRRQVDRYAEGFASIESETEEKPVKERPILFSTDMVRAVLDGLKTQTRRVINVKGREWIQHDKFVHVENPKDGVSEIWWDVIRGGPTCVDQDYDYMKCPFGQKGDFLYVRETFMPKYFDDNSPAFKADWNDVAADLLPELKWKPSIHMPKKASRIWLRVKDLRVERVQDITPDDIRLEGVKCDDDPADALLYDRWIKLWDSINADRGFGWETNPYVWVVDFEIVSTNGKPQK